MPQPALPITGAILPTPNADTNAWPGILNTAITAINKGLSSAVNQISTSQTLTLGPSQRTSYYITTGTAVLSHPLVAPSNLIIGLRIYAQKIDSGSGTSTITGNLPAWLSGGPSVLLRVQGQFVELECDGTTWQIANQGIVG